MNFNPKSLVIVAVVLFHGMAIAGPKVASLQILNDNINRLGQEASKLNSQNCLELLGAATEFFDSWVPDVRERSVYFAQGPEILNKMFASRLQLRSSIGALSPVCVDKLKTLFTTMRAAEDTIGVMTYDEKQLIANELAFDKQAVPLMEREKYRPFHVPAGFPAELNLKKGDIMITKGISILSSTISSVAKNKSLFSHIVFITQDPATKEFGSFESYVGLGVNRYGLKEALLNENARILILRPKDQNLALAAHDYMFKRVQSSVESKKHIPYDYAQDFSDNSRLTCEEIAYDAYRTASQGKVQIPWLESVIEIKDRNFVESSGLHNGNIMMPADMEVDPRFDIVLDWTDYRLVRDNWRKDAIMSEVVRWINEKNYILYDTFSARMAKLIWFTRPIGFLWPTLSKLAKIPSQFEKEVPAKGLALIVNLKAIEPQIMNALRPADEAFYQQTGRWMSRQELRDQVELIRNQDLEKYNQTGFSKFHYFFRAP